MKGNEISLNSISVLTSNRKKRQERVINGFRKKSHRKLFNYLSIGYWQQIWLCETNFVAANELKHVHHRLILMLISFPSWVSTSAVLKSTVIQSTRFWRYRSRFFCCWDKTLSNDIIDLFSVPAAPQMEFNSCKSFCRNRAGVRFQLQFIERVQRLCRKVLFTQELELVLGVWHDSILSSPRKCLSVCACHPLQHQPWGPFRAQLLLCENCCIYNDKTSKRMNWFIWFFFSPLLIARLQNGKQMFFFLRLYFQCLFIPLLFKRFLPLSAALFFCLFILLFEFQTAATWTRIVLRFSIPVQHAWQNWFSF